MDEVQLIEELFDFINSDLQPRVIVALEDTLFCGEPDSALIVMKGMIRELNLQIPEKFSPIL